jgi:hypothetical protein
MGNLRACSAVALLALAACGSDHSKVDASIQIMDAKEIDAKIWEDAPPPMYDLTCYGVNPPTTAADPITISGSTQELGMNGTQPVPLVVVEVFKNGTVNPVATVTSDAQGAFMTGNIATGGTPLDGYIRAAKISYRTTYLYPPTVVAASLTGVPAILLSNTLFGQLDGFANGGSQDDTNNGVLFFAVTDCSLTPTPITEATVKVQQNGTDVGTIFDLGQLAPQAAGTYVVFNVPDGPTQILATYNSMAFPTRTVVAHKKPNGLNSEGTVTFTTVRPGP